MTASPTSYNFISRVVAFLGPSSPKTKYPSDVSILPPAARGDLLPFIGHRDTMLVLIDGVFLHRPALTHYELLTLLNSGTPILGAASLGAIRAVELRNEGMIGLGTVFQAYLNDQIVDDGEVAQAVCPYSHEGLTIPMVNIRRCLFLGSKQDIQSDMLSRAYATADSIHFLDRSEARLKIAWQDQIGVDCAKILIDLLATDGCDVKKEDADLALTAACESFGKPRLFIGQKNALELYSPPPEGSNA
jgi:hypothetical protein